MCTMFLIPTSSQYIDRFFLYLTQKNHLERFRLSHWHTLAVAYPPVPTVGTSTLMLIVYGGVCPDSGVTLENAWDEIGVVPFTKKCLTNKKVCHDVTDKDYPNFYLFQDI
jgi:hypothetical protein